MPIVINKEKCTGCENCLSSCPFSAIVIKEGKAFINEYCQVCMLCLSVCPEGAIVEIKDISPTPALTDEYKGVWVFAEVRDSKVVGVSYELLGIGRRLADELNVELTAILFGGDKESAQELIRWGADKVYHSDDQIFEKFNDEPYTELLSSLIQMHKPEIVLAGATAIGRSFIPRVAARLRTGLTADCTGLFIDKETRDLLQVRPAFGGNIMATIICPNRRPQMATVRPRVMKRCEYIKDRDGEIIDVSVKNLKLKSRVFETIRGKKETLTLQEADIIVSGGRGLGGEKGFRLINELAELLGGGVGASRGAVDEGLAEYSQQVGQTGKTVCPRLYIACGISGAVQHLVGMQSSEIIVAINKNSSAPIFGVATYGIIGDVFEVIPLLMRKLKELRS